MEKSEIDIIREESKALGVLQKINYDQAHNELLKYAMLYQVRESKEYKACGLTWEQFCNEIGESKRTVNDKLKDIAPLVDNFQASLAHFSNVPFNKIRYLGKKIGEDRAELAQSETSSIVINQKEIPISSENKEVIESEIDSMINKHKEEKKMLAKLRTQPSIENLIPDLKTLLDNGKITKAVALNYSQLPEEGQKIQLLVENARIRTMDRVSQLEEELKNAEDGVLDMVGAASDRIKAQKEAELQQKEDELQQAKKDVLTAKEDVEESLRESIRAELQKEVDKAKAAQEKAERERKQALESMSAAHKETARLEKENENLKNQTEVSSPEMVDNKWASMLEKQGKDLMDYITLMTNDMDRSGGFPTSSVEVLNDIMHKLSEELDRIENNAIIEI